MTAKKVNFHVYRYQILPINRFFQGELFGPKSMEELLRLKNRIFWEAIESLPGFASNRTEISTKSIHKSDDFYLFKLAANRAINHETRDFQNEELDNWPSIYCAIWNDPEAQYVLIQDRPLAFQDTEYVLKVIFENLEPILERRQLRCATEPLFEKKAFWDMAYKFVGRIREIDFEIITPNMSNISSTLPEDLTAFAKRTNSIRNHLRISADPASALKVEESNETMASLVDYSSLGGGNISVKITGASKRYHTNRTHKEIDIEEMTLHGNPSNVVQALKELLK